MTLIDVEQGTAVPDPTVVIDQGRIAAVTPVEAADLPEGTAWIDARGMFLMPALWDMHAHVYAISPLLDLPLYIAYGVTNVRDMQGCPKAGDPFIGRQAALDARSAARAACGPADRCFLQFHGEWTGDARPPLRGATLLATPNEARAFVRHFAAQGVEAIKVYDRVPAMPILRS